MAGITSLNYQPATVYRLRDFFSIHWYWRPNPYVPFQRFRETFNLNRIPDLDIRKAAAEVMAETITEALKTGWNPEKDEYPGGNDSLTSEAAKFYLPETLKAAQKSILLKSNKLRTHSSYKSLLKLFTEYLERKGRYKIAPDQFTAMDAQGYLDELIRSGYHPKTVNTKFDYAAGLFNWMHTSGIIPLNPFVNIRRLREPEEDEESQLFTAKEIETFKKHLHTDGAYPEMWQWFLFIYYCFMRPESIVAIKGEDIDIKGKRIRIAPEDHKNSKVAYKQLLQHHLDYLIPYLAANPVADNEYLFSRKLKPGNKRIAPTRGAELWKVHVKDALGINKNAYNGKHTGGTQYVIDNPYKEDLKWLQNQMSHSNLQQTAAYVARKRKVSLEADQDKIKKI